MAHRGWIGSAAVLLLVLATGGGLAFWKRSSIEASEAASAHQPEPTETVMVAVARKVEHQQATTSIGTVVALRSITLRNELPGTVRRMALVPGQIVDTGAVLVALDVSVEEAELAAQEAQVALAESSLARIERASKDRAASETEVDRALAERDVARAQIERTRAIIARKTIRAPFRSRVGIADVHPGQYLEEGTLLTTLQGVDETAYVDFTVAQEVAARLREGTDVEVIAGDNAAPIAAAIIALDSRVDPATRNATVRARIHNATHGPAPGASVRVRVPVGPLQAAVAIPVSALRRGPGGDQVFVVAPDEAGQTRAQVRRVRSGAMLGDEVVIQEGLKAGERVAASGSFKLRESALVSVVEETASAAGAVR